MEKSTNRTVAKIAKQVMMQNSETKRLMAEYNESAQTTNTLETVELTNIAQGDDMQQRTGRQLLLKGQFIMAIIMSLLW